MTKYRYDGPFDEVDVPQLGVSVKRGHQVEATGDVARSLEEQADWTKVAPPRKTTAKKAAQGASRKSSGTKGRAKAPSAGDKPGAGDVPPSGPTPTNQNSEE